MECSGIDTERNVGLGLHAYSQIEVLALMSHLPDLTYLHLKGGEGEVVNNITLEEPKGFIMLQSMLAYIFFNTCYMPETKPDPS